MSSTFTRAIELAKMLPETDQEALGSLLIDEMRSQKRWAGLFGSSQDELARLADCSS